MTVTEIRNTAKFKVTFEFRYKGIWREDYFSNNDEGFTYNDALEVKGELTDIDGMPIRNVKIEAL